MTADEFDSALAAGTLELIIGCEWYPAERFPNTRTKRFGRKFNAKLMVAGDTRRPYKVNEFTHRDEMRDTRRNGPND